MSDKQIKNAIIESAHITCEGILTVWLQLDYGNSCQGFGGYALYLPDSRVLPPDKRDCGGQFILRCMEIARVNSWKDMKGRCIRVLADDTKVYAIGHILEEEWFNPSEDLFMCYGAMS